MQSLRPWIRALCVASCLVSSGNAADDPKGQADLDRALDARLGAKNLSELSEVVALCRSASSKGLDDDGEKLAKQILASSLYQRGEAVAEAVLGALRPDDRTKEMRRAAVVDLSEAAESDGDLPQAQLLIARLELLPGGDPRRAKQALDEALESKRADGPLKSKALTYRSVLHEKPADRLADLDRAIAADPHDPQPMRLRAALKLSQNEPDEAIADFDAALKLDPNNAATHEARGLALATQQKWDEARRSLTRATELAPQSTAAFLQRGRVALLMGDHKAAAADAEAALKAVPDLPTALLLRGQAKHAAGDKTGARADIERVLKKFPDAEDALRTRAMMNVDEGRTDDAITDLERLVESAEPDRGVMLQLAVLHNAKKNSQRAIELTDKVLEQDKGTWQALRIRADANLNLGRRGASIADYEAAVKLEPKDAGLLNNLAWVLATAPEAKLRNGKRAVELAALACQLTEYKTPHILSTLAAAHAETGDFETARRWSQKALDAAESDEEKTALRKELESYRASKPWRENAPGEPATE